MACFRNLTCSHSGVKYLAVKELQDLIFCWQILENVEPVKENELIERFENEFGKIHLLIKIEEKNIEVVELFAGVGGFRIGLEKASSKYKTVLANHGSHQQKYNMQPMFTENSLARCFSIEDINVLLENYSFPNHDLLFGGFHARFLCS